MKYSISDTSGVSFATVTSSKLKTFVAYISVDIHEEQTARLRAAQLLYTDALISGAGKYSRAAFLDAINSLGATVSANISDGVFTLRLRCAVDVSKKILSLVETMLLEPHFDTKELKRIKLTVVNNLKESKEDARAIAHELLRNTFYGQHDRRYTFEDEALIKNIATIAPKDLQVLHKKICAVSWTCSVATTEDAIIDTKKTVAKVKRSAKKDSGLLGIHQQRPPQPLLILRDIPSKQNIDFSIGVPVPITFHHPDFIPLSFGLMVLGGAGFASRLMSTVREEEGLTYGIHAQAATFLNEEQGYIRIATFFAPDKALQGLKSTFREIKKMHDFGIDKKELTQYKTIYQTKLALLKDSTARQLGDLHAYHLQKFTLEEIIEHKKRVDTLTLKEVNTAIRHYLAPASFTVSGAGPTVSVQKVLKAFIKTVA